MLNVIKLNAAKQSAFVLSVVILIVMALRSEPIYMSSSEVRRQGWDCLRVTNTLEFTNQMLVSKYSLEWRSPTLNNTTAYYDGDLIMHMIFIIKGPSIVTSWHDVSSEPSAQSSSLLHRSGWSQFYKTFLIYDWSSGQISKIYDNGNIVQCLWARPESTWIKLLWSRIGSWPYSKTLDNVIKTRQEQTF